MTFNEFWNGPCRKMQKRLAEKRFAAIPKSEHDKLAVALKNYGDYCRRETWYQPMYASVFLGDRKGWKDWVSPEQSVQERDLFACVPEVKQETHYCDVCQTRYPCPEPETCGAGDSVICRKCYAEVFRK